MILHTGKRSTELTGIKTDVQPKYFAHRKWEEYQYVCVKTRAVCRSLVRIKKELNIQGELSF